VKLTDKVWLAFDNLRGSMEMLTKGPIIFNVQHTTTLSKPEVIVVVVLFFQVNGIARFRWF